MPSPFLPEHIHDLADVGSPDISPDGRWAVYVVTTTEKASMSTRSRLEMRALPDGETVLFTQGPKDGHPRFSPDGQTVAFLRPGEKEKRQIWLIRASGGEARALTKMESGVKDFAWSPDGKRLAAVAVISLDSDCSTEGEREPGSRGANAVTDYPKAWVARRVRYRDDGDGWRGDAFSQLFLVDAATGEATQITVGEGNHEAPAWSPDGKRIAYVCDVVDGRDFSRHSDARVMTIEGAKAGQATCWSEGMSRVGSVAWSFDSERLAAVGADDEAVWDARMSWLFVLEEGKPPRRLTDGSTTVVAPLAERSWTKEGIVCIGDRAGESFLCRVKNQNPSNHREHRKHREKQGEAKAAMDPEIERIVGGGRVYTAIAMDGAGKSAAVVAGTTEAPGDVAVIDTGAKRERRLTRINAQVLAEHPGARVEKLTFERAGQTIEARVLFPPAFDPKRSHPLILEIHGGPNGRFSDSYDVVQQILCGAGYLVLAVNPRGSSSYGPEFVKAVLRDWGGEDFRDLMAAVDLLCERSYVDRDRLGVHGYSYGGFMSSWIVGHDHRFKAAVIGAPCINLYSMYGTSDIGVSFGENQWGGNAVDDIAPLLERSPLTYAKEVRTPVLLMHGEDDFRCPIEQSEQFFVALKRQGKTAEFVRFPHGCSHGFRKSAHPKLREEYYARMVAWMDRYVGKAGDREIGR